MPKASGFTLKTMGKAVFINLKNGDVMVPVEMVGREPLDGAGVYRLRDLFRGTTFCVFVRFSRSAKDVAKSREFVEAAFPLLPKGIWAREWEGEVAPVGPASLERDTSVPVLDVLTGNVFNCSTDEVFVDHYGAVVGETRLTVGDQELYPGRLVGLVDDGE